MKPSKFAIEVDPSTLDAARQGSEHAREELFRLFETPVYTLAIRICQCSEEAWDILQDTFIQAFTRLDQFQGKSPFWGWLRQIAVNCCLARLRQRRRADVTWLTDSMLPPSDSGADLQVDLQTALGRLSSDMRAVVWLYDVEGFSHKEIAASFNKSVSFSKTQLSRAHARLRDLLNDTGGSLCQTSATP